MAVNEILAPYYLKVQYGTPYAQHWMTLYFETGSTIIPPNQLSVSDWKIHGQTLAEGTFVSNIVGGLFARAGYMLPQNTRVNEIQIMQSAVGANLFVGNNSIPTDVYGQAQQPHPSAYAMIVMSSAVKQQFRLTFFDGQFVDPQKVSGGSAPLADDGSVRWYLTRSNIPFATQDGHRLGAEKSSNYGYNRKLARAYGRRL